MIKQLFYKVAAIKVFGWVHLLHKENYCDLHNLIFKSKSISAIFFYIINVIVLILIRKTQLVLKLSLTIYKYQY